MKTEDKYQIIITGKKSVQKTPGTHKLTNVLRNTKKLNLGFIFMKLDLFAHFTLISVGRK